MSSEPEACGLLDESTVLVVRAGKSHDEELLPLLEESDVAESAIPTEGLGIGEKFA